MVNSVRRLVWGVKISFLYAALAKPSIVWSALADGTNFALWILISVDPAAANGDPDLLLQQQDWKNGRLKAVDLCFYFVGLTTF